MPTGGGYCHPAGSSQRKSPVPAPGPRCREFSRGLTGAPRSGAPPFIPARPQSPAVPATAGAPEGPAAQRALRRVPAVLLSPLSLPHGCLQLRILKAFPPAAAAVSALTEYLLAGDFLSSPLSTFGFSIISLCLLKQQMSALPVLTLSAVQNCSVG